MKRTGHADLPLHTGTVPKWLADRMMQMGTLIVESIVQNYGKREVLLRLSDPLWFQSFGAVMGMDWHSSGITTSVMYALKRGLNARAKELGLCVCGGRGKYSRQTPDELRFLGDATGMDADALIRASKLTAKVDNTAVQDGYQLYMHNFILADDGSWAVVQQGMNPAAKTARRYHWCSLALPQTADSFVNAPHTGIIGENRGTILNLTATEADGTRSSILSLVKEDPAKVIKEAELIASCSTPPVPQTGSLFEAQYLQGVQKSLSMPAHHEVRKEDVDLKRLGAVLATSHGQNPDNFENLLLTPGLGPRTLQSLTLVSEVINGTPSRFTDPARFSFAHGGKDGHPFPVPLTIYDESIRVLHDSIEKSKLGYNDKSECIRRLHQSALAIEQHCEPEANFDAVLKYEKAHSKEWNGRTC